MAKITIEELFYGDKYNVMGEVVKQVFARQDVRLLVWNMLVIAFSNKNYSSFERKLIKHIVRVWNMDRTVFLEMEQIIKTHADIMSNWNIPIKAIVLIPRCVPSLMSWSAVKRWC